MWEGWFSIEIPEGWQLDESRESISIFNPNGFGAFTISLLSSIDPTSKDGCYVARRFAAQRGWEVPDKAFRLETRKGESICSFEYNTSDGPIEYWLVSSFRAPHRAALLTYTCLFADRSKESLQRHQICESFRWETLQSKHKLS
jgi:hypothetical protein